MQQQVQQMPSFQDLVGLARAIPTDSPTSNDDWQQLSNSVPDRMSWEDILAGVANEGQTYSSSVLLAILACLKGRTEKLGEDEASINSLCVYVAATIAPCSTQPGKHDDDDDDDDKETPDYDEIASRSRATALYGLEILHFLDSNYPNIKLDDTVLLTLISFTDVSEPWTTETTRDLAIAVLDRQLPPGSARLEEVLVEAILKVYLRPLFSKTRPSTVTPAGRKAAFQDEHDPHRGLADENAAVKPWKFVDHRAVPALHFAVRKAEEALISKQWPLFIPVILTLLDDVSTRIRSRGLVILNEFLVKFPNHILRDTGLASVFEDAVFPTLHFLPNTTPEAESIQLLVPSYAALLALAKKADAKPKTGQYYNDTPKANLLDKILREGVFAAYFHAKEHIRIVEVLLISTAQIMKEMGIYAVKHLKDLIPMHSEIMTNPFAALDSPTLLAAIKSLQAIIENCWPRIAAPPYQSELVRTLVMCFLTIHDDRDRLGAQFSVIEAELITTAAMLSAVSKTSGNGEWARDDSSLQHQVAPLIAKEPLLQRLFIE